MSKKHFSWLLVITVIVAAAVLLVPGKTGRESALEATKLLPGLESRVNEIEWLRFTAAGSETVATLRRGQGAWVVEEAAGYRADWVKLKKLLTDLAEAEVVEAKTSNPDYYDRLGVEDVAAEDAGGVLIEFSSDSGIPALIVGKTPQGRNGQYARLGDSAASVLVDRSLDLPTERSGWLDRAIVDISDQEVVEVSIAHPDGEKLRILKDSAVDENFSLQDIPEAREIRSDWTVNAPANALAGLMLEAVARESDVAWSEAIHYSLVTADRLVVDADLVRIEPADAAASDPAEHWLRLKAGVYTTTREPDAEAAGVPEDTQARARALNQGLEGWAYRIPQYKYDAMVKRLEDLLKPQENTDGPED
jgi:hypothetical protein